MAEKIKIGVVTFTDPRSVDLVAEQEKYNLQNQRETVDFLRQKGFEVVETFGGDKEVAIRSSEQLNKCIQKFRCQGVECLVVGCWKWTDPMLAVE
ncbi:MAG: hypothetical protein ACE5NG_16150, partial [bacterium]